MRRLLTMVTPLGLVLLVSPVFAGPVTNLAQTRIVKRVTKTKIPADVVYVFNREIGAGRMKKTSEGVDGEKQTVVHEIRSGDKVVGKKTTVTITKEAKPAVIEMGRTGFATSRGSFTRSKVMTVEATAYLPTDGSAEGLTATGRKARFGVIAVDPKVIPLHSLVYVEGYGFAIAADTGGAIKGNRIDVCFHDARTVDNWGRRKVTIHVFKEKASKKE